MRAAGSELWPPPEGPQESDGPASPPAGAAPNSERPASRTRHRRCHLGEPHPSPAADVDELLALLDGLDALGCAPLLADARPAGNASLRLATGGLLISPSGRPPSSARAREDLVELVGFDPGSWTARYRSRSASLEPSSDAALHWAALVEAPAQNAWHETPRVAVHGHALASADVAARLGLPISPRATDFGTPADRAALLELLASHPYPAHDVYVRRGHGFFLLARDAAAALTRLTSLLVSARDADVLDPAPPAHPKGDR